MNTGNDRRTSKKLDFLIKWQGNHKKISSLRFSRFGEIFSTDSKNNVSHLSF